MFVVVQVDSSPAEVLVLRGRSECLCSDKTFVIGVNWKRERERERERQRRERERDRQRGRMGEGKRERRGGVHVRASQPFLFFTEQRFVSDKLVLPVVLHCVRECAWHVLVVGQMWPGVWKRQSVGRFEVLSSVIASQLTGQRAEGGAIQQSGHQGGPAIVTRPVVSQSACQSHTVNWEQLSIPGMSCRHVPLRVTSCCFV